MLWFHEEDSSCSRSSQFAVRSSQFACIALLLSGVAGRTAGQIPTGNWSLGVNHPQGAPLLPVGASWPATFEAINMAVIPNGAGSEKVIVWDKNEGNQSVPGPFNGNWEQRFAVGDPETNTWKNYIWTVPLQPNPPEHYGDLFCSGHVWLPDGRLFVAGGNAVYGNAALPPGTPIALPGGTPFILPNTYYGSRIAAIWDPAAPRSAATNYGWTLLPRMRVPRWYPTVTLLANNAVLVSGGVVTYPSFGTCGSLDAANNTYEVFDMVSGNWETEGIPPVQALYSGPAGSSCVVSLGEYPRMHLLSNNRVFMSGMYSGSNRLWHDRLYTPPGGQPAAIEFWDSSPPPPGLPTPGWPVPAAGFREYGASVFLPNVGRTGRSNLVMAIGGRLNPGGTTAGTQVIQAAATSPSWVAGAPLNFARMHLNAVLLPNAEVIAIGGAISGYAPVAGPQLTSEIYRAGSWVLDATQTSIRGYHSTAGLLPNGKVVSAGGDQRSSDYETYTPGYLLPPPGVSRPAFAAGSTLPQTLFWNTDYQIDHEPMGDERVQRVVLMRPCSTTHHSDMDQHYLELAIVEPPSVGGGVQALQGDWVWVRTPVAPVTGATNSVSALRGWYMMFLVSDRGYVSDARRVRFP